MTRIGVISNPGHRSGMLMLLMAWYPLNIIVCLFVLRTLKFWSTDSSIYRKGLMWLIWRKFIAKISDSVYITFYSITYKQIEEVVIMYNIVSNLFTVQVSDIGCFDNPLWWLDISESVKIQSMTDMLVISIFTLVNLTSNPSNAIRLCCYWVQNPKNQFFNL